MCNDYALEFIVMYKIRMNLLGHFLHRQNIHKTHLTRQKCEISHF
jgi:hypothetical protein